MLARTKIKSKLVDVTINFYCLNYINLMCAEFRDSYMDMNYLTWVFFFLSTFQVLMMSRVEHENNECQTKPFLK